MKAKRIKKPKTTTQFTVLVDIELLKQANLARVDTWPFYVERMLREIVASKGKKP